jgi:hypothetical protein
MSVVRDVEHAEILHVGPVADADEMHVTTDDGIEPDATLLAHDHVADDHGGILDVGGRWNGRLNALKSADHAASGGSKK